jgi:hypothetical protein
MEDRTRTLPHRESKVQLRVGTPVEVTRGLLRGTSGVLTDFRDNDCCLIELNLVQAGVLLMIDRAAVEVRRRGHVQTAEV